MAFSKKHIFFICSLAVLFLVNSLYIFGLGGPWIDIVGEFAYLIPPFLAAGIALNLSINMGIRGRQGMSLFFISLGFFFWSAGETLWAIYDFVLGIDPFPSIADVFYLLAYIPFFVGIVMQLIIGKLRLDKKRIYAVSIFSLILGCLVFYFGIYLAYDPDVAMLENIIAIGYGAGDFVLVLLGVYLLLLSMEYMGGRFSISWLYFFFGLILTLVADILFAMFTEQYESGIFLYTLIDLLWVLSYVVFAYGFYYHGAALQYVQRKYLKK